MKQCILSVECFAYSMALLSILFIAAVLCTACMDLQKRTAPKHQFTPEEIYILDHIEKPL